jgi:hypothetical protein
VAKDLLTKAKNQLGNAILQKRKEIEQLNLLGAQYVWFNSSLYFVLFFLRTLQFRFMSTWMSETTHWNRDSMNETCLALQNMNVNAGRFETTKI